MKKIVSVIMAVIMCLSVAVVGTTSAGAKTNNSKAQNISFTFGVKGQKAKSVYNFFKGQKYNLVAELKVDNKFININNCIKKWIGMSVSSNNYVGITQKNNNITARVKKANRYFGNTIKAKINYKKLIPILQKNKFVKNSTINKIKMLQKEDDANTYINFILCANLKAMKFKITNIERGLIGNKKAKIHIETPIENNYYVYNGIFPNHKIKNRNFNTYNICIVSNNKGNVIIKLYYNNDNKSPHNITIKTKYNNLFKKNYVFYGY